MSGQTRQVLISVVVPFYNRAAGVRSCLEAILAQQVPADLSVEVIAVDNASTDTTREEVQKFPVKLVDCWRRGPAAARNAGIVAAQGDIIAFTDSDCIAQPGWLTELTAPFRAADVLVTGGVIAPGGGESWIARFTEEYRILDNEKFFEGPLCFPPFFATANAAYRTDVLREVEGFDEEIWMGEDSDVCWRVMDLGGKIVYCPGAVVRHEHRSDLAGFFRQSRDYGSSAAHVFAKHRDQLGLRSYVHWEHIRSLARLPAILLKRQFTRRSRFEKIAPFFDLVWRTGFAYGCLRGSLRHKVLFF